MAKLNKAMGYISGFAFVFLLLGIIAGIVLGLVHLCPPLLSFMVVIGGACGVVGSIIGFIRGERFGLGFLKNAIANNALWFVLSAGVILCGLHLLGVICLWGRCS